MICQCAYCGEVFDAYLDGWAYEDGMYCMECIPYLDVDDPALIHYLGDPARLSTNLTKEARQFLARWRRKS